MIYGTIIDIMRCVYSCSREESDYVENYTAPDLINGAVDHTQPVLFV